MRMGKFFMRATLAAAAIGGFTLPLLAQPPAPVIPDNARNPFAGDQPAITKGAVLFRQECMYCHGVSARGGMRGPDLTTGSWNHGGTDVDLARTIVDGVPGTDMPRHNSKIDEVGKIVSSPGTGQQPAAPPTGDRARGEALFFGPARCSTCHIVNGRGGRLGPELSTAGSARSRVYLV